MDESRVNRRQMVLLLRTNSNVKGRRVLRRVYRHWGSPYGDTFHGFVTWLLHGCNPAPPPASFYGTRFFNDVVRHG